MGITQKNQVVLQDLEEKKDGQLWKKEEPDSKGYFNLTSSLKGLPFHKQIPKVISAISESGLEIEGNLTEIDTNV